MALRVNNLTRVNIRWDITAAINHPQSQRDVRDNYIVILLRAYFTLLISEQGSLSRPTTEKAW